MKIAKVNVYVEAYYSGNHYQETRFAKYDEVKHLDGTEMGICELDGKHSCCYGTIHVELVDSSYFDEHSEPYNEGDRLFYHITEGLEIDGSAFIKPTFGKVEREITCTQAQWEQIQLILGGR